MRDTRGIIIQKIIFAVLVGVTMNLVLQLFFGDNGLRARRNALEYREQLVEHTEQLRERQDTLYDTVADLQNNEERLLIEAREIGFYLPNEVVVRFIDQPTVRNELVEDRQLSATRAAGAASTEARQRRKTLFRSIGAAFGMLALIAALLLVPPEPDSSA